MPAATPRTGLRWRSAASRSIVGSLGATGLGQIASIVSGVLVARSLGPEDRGYFALLVVVSGVCSVIGSIGLPSAVTYFIARDRTHARAIASSLLKPAVLSVGAALLLQIAVLVALVYNEPQRVKVAAVISLLLVPGLIAFAYGIGILQGQQRFAAFNVFRMLPTGAYVAAVVAVFVLHSADLERIMTTWTVAYFVGGFLALGAAVRGLPRAPASSAPPSRSEMTRFGLKGLLGSVSPVEAYRLDQAVVGLFITPVALGLYVVAQAFTNLPRLVAGSVGFVAYPQVAAHRDPAAARRAMWRYFFLGVALTTAVVVALEVSTGYLVRVFFGSEFHSATPIARLLVLGTLFTAARRVLTDGVNGMGYPGLGTIAEVASWIFLVPCLAILLPEFGVNGVALALAIAWGASLVLLLVLVGMGDAPRARALQTSRDLMRRVAALRLTARRGAGAVAVVLVAVLAGLTVGLAPAVAFGLALTFMVALFFAFGRRALAQHRRLQLRLADLTASRASAEPPARPPSDADLAFPRRLYYGGVLTLSLLTVRAPGGHLTVSDFLFFFSLAFACAEFVILRRRVPIRLPFLFSVGIAVFAVGASISTFASYQPFHSFTVIARILFLTILWFWLGTVVLQRREHVTRALGLWVASAAICGVGGILQVAGGGNVMFGGPWDGGRASGFTTHPNELGGVTAIAFVPALMLASRPGLSFGKRAASYLMLLLIAGGLIVSGSVGSILAAIAATFVWLAFNRASIHLVHVLATLVVCVVALTTLQAMRGAPTPIDRFRSTTTAPSTGVDTTGSVDQRLATYRVGVARIKKDPFVGVGLDVYSVTRPFGTESDEYDQHNLLIGLWYKTGLVGLTGMLLAFLGIFRSGWRAISASKSTDEWQFAVALFGSAVAFVVFAMSEPILFSRFAWISAALVLALGAVQWEESAEVAVESAGREPEPPGVVLAPARS